MHIISKTFARCTRDFLFLLRPMSTEVNKDAETKNPNNFKKTESALNEPIFYHKRARIDADIKGNQISFEYQTSARMNYDIWQMVVDFIQTITHRNKLVEARAEVAELAKKLNIVQNEKKEIDVELEKLLQTLAQNFPKEHRETYQTLSEAIRQASVKEQAVSADLRTAINSSYKHEDLHSRFLRASVFIGIAATFILTIISFYIYNFKLQREINDKKLKLNELNAKLGNVNSNKQSWGSYVNGYVSPLYNWALPKK